jgi:carbon starvation protein
MSAIIALFMLIILYFLGYRTYASFIDRKVVFPDKDAITPAHSLNDGVDFYPAKKIVLLGHHFGSIAGAGPILGPVIAVYYFGWLPALLWICIGCILIGGVHDYLTLVTSVRNEGRSISDIAGKVIGRWTKIILAVFLWLALVLVISVFGVVASKTLVKKPEIIIPTFSLIPIAILFGFLVYRKKLNVFLSTSIALIFLFFSIWLGYLFPIEFINEKIAFYIWFILLMLYGFIASVLPVWLLLQPRDYLATYILFIGVGLGFLGIFFSPTSLNAPAFIRFNSDMGPLWPMLFVIIACGAISGFHSLVAGGTTSKQLNNEVEGKFIGYGGMILEGVVGTMAALVVAAGLYWEVAPTGVDPDMVYQTAKEKSWIIAFSCGFGNIVENLPFINAPAALLFPMFMLNSFVLTSLDSATRLGRFIVQETLLFSWIKNRWLSGLIIIIPAIILGGTNAWEEIWEIFGSANQLIATLTLFVISAYLLTLKKPTGYTLYPAIFMAFTTNCALIYLTFWKFLPQGKILLGVTSIILLGLSFFVIFKVYRFFYNVKI